jgi:MoaA/NifB/PqqE/SkfB family radical SAM enzyme
MTEEDFPKNIIIDTTNFCNLKCSMCARRYMTRQKKHMSFSLFRKIIDEIAETSPSTRVWMAFYGEPLILRDSIVWMIYYAKSKGLKKLLLNTNGTLLNAEISKGLIESGLDEIIIGVDAFTPENYKKIRVGGDYEKVLQNINQLLNLKKTMHKNSPIVKIQIIAMDENKHEMKAFIKYWTEQGTIVKVRPKISWIGAVKVKKSDTVQRYPCYWGMEIMPILCDGSVVLCGADYNGNFIAGNVNTESIRSIWMGTLKKIRDAHKEGRFDRLPEFCQKCTDWQDAQAEYYQ